MKKKNAEKIKENFKNWKNVHIPTVYFASKNILIEDYCEGIVIEDFKKKYPEYLLEAHTLINWISRKMIMCDGYFHADLHNGNILYFVRNNEVHISLIDFGLVEKVREDRKHYTCEYFKYLFIPDDKYIIPLIMTTLKYENLEIKNKIKDYVNKLLNYKEDLLSNYLIYNKITMLDIINDPLILKNMINIDENPSEDEFNNRYCFDKIFKDISDMGAKLDYYNLLSITIIESLEIVITTKLNISSIKNKYEYYNYYRQRLIYGIKHNLYDFKKNEWINY